ncbi:MAG: ParB/RepB/Spo0J family partition protein [Actinomycetota bacterium]|nr:chromosome partitioning protein ParB [Acidimicrobiaceae bacterium]MEC7900158.1 ParB/RepB/Spo0J family partition protein [Actinomycetota bacterium]|tara:strand:+ start:2785 stop:3699 length:915 start_codon:yes stop_codon:yes gene_type:complete
MSKKTGLGRGLSALIPDSTTTPQQTNSIGNLEIEDTFSESTDLVLRELPLADIERNPYQPRTVFDDEKLVELTSSIKEVGVLQPVLVREKSTGYELIAGERRWLAARRAGLSSVPALVRKIEDLESFEQAIIENLHREDLNSIDEAVAFHRLMDEFGMTQQQVAERVGRSRPVVANTLRLLQLSSGVQRMIMDGELTAGHARCLAGLTDRKIQEKLASRVVSEALSVRQLEFIVSELQDESKHNNVEKIILNQSDKAAAHLEVEMVLSEKFDTKVSVISRGKRGRIAIEFADPEDLKRIFDLIA